MQPSVGVQHEPKEWITLRPTARSSWLEHVARRWTASVVGQPQATDAILRLLQRIEVQARQPRHTMGSVILLGPPGCGKTHSVEALAEVLIGSPSALLKINCAEFQQQHETARLVGAPPGYIGHADTEPVFTHENLERYRTPEFPFTLILFDEIEKAHHSLYSLLLGVLDRAEMNDGRNRHVDFSSCLFFFTSNIGSKESLRATAPSGFIPQLDEEEAKARHFRSVSLRALKRHFPPEFLRRVEETIVYRPLCPADLKKILDLELAKASRVFRQHPTTPFQVDFTPGAKSLLLHHGCDTEYGAAHLQHTLACEFQDPLYRLMATRQVRAGDKIGVFAKGSELIFRRS
jgi:ATP-dependent Clp protease ATP-binding subunit ClpA